MGPEVLVVCRCPGGMEYSYSYSYSQDRPYMLWASGSQGWTVPGMRRVRYYLTSYKLALPDITRVPPATNIALRRRLATEWKMCARDDSEAIQRRSHPPRWTVCSGATCDCVCGPREAWTEPTIMPTGEWQGNTLMGFVVFCVTLVSLIGWGMRGVGGVVVCSVHRGLRW